jgi:biopolymer transport protein ExbD
MKFYPRRRRTAPAIIIISLIDVLIVMLVFLLVSTTFKNQPSVKLSLPETSEAPKGGAAKEKPPMVVTVAREDPHYYVGNRPVTAEKLQTELKVAASADPDTHLVIRADGGAEWRLVVKVMEYAKQAPIKNVKAFTKGAGQK